MFDYYQGYPKEQIELLVSLPFFWNHDNAGFKWVLERLFPERLQISLGLLILSIGGQPFLVSGVQLCLCDADFIWLGCWDDQCQGHFHHQ